MNLTSIYFAAVATGTRGAVLWSLGTVAGGFSALPEVDYPTIQVLTFYPGASPDVMATTVTAPLERQFGELQGLSQMTSTSAGGTSVVVLRLKPDVEHRCCRRRGPVRHQRFAEPAPGQPACAADLQ